MSVYVHHIDDQWVTEGPFPDVTILAPDLYSQIAPGGDEITLIAPNREPVVYHIEGFDPVGGGFLIRRTTDSTWMLKEMLGGNP